MWHIERHICCWPIHGSNVSSRYCSWLILKNILKSIWSRCLYSKMAVWVIFAMWQSYLFNDIKHVYSDRGVNIGHICCTGVVYDNVSVVFMLWVFSINNKVNLVAFANIY